MGGIWRGSKMTSEQTKKKMISAEAKRFKEKKKNEIKKKENPTELEQEFVKEEKPAKISSEAVSEYVKEWAACKLTPQVVETIKYVAKNSDFTVQELKDFIKEEQKTEEKTEEKDERTEEQRDIKEYYIDLAKEKKWGPASEVLVSYIKNNNRLYTIKNDNKTEIWIYRDGIYQPEGKSEIKEILRKLLGSWYSAFVFNGVIAKIEPDTFIEADDFFNRNYKEEIPVQNGILNVVTKKLNPFTPNKIFISKLPVGYNPEATCKNIEKFLEDVLSNQEDKKVFYELGGFTLFKEYTFEKAFMLIGEGRNGKGKTLELIKRVIGAENCYSLTLSALDSQNADVHQLFGKLINMAGDIGSTDLKETAMFKALTGRDLITAKRKFLPAITFENYAKFVFACNDLPMVYDLSKGFWDRWVLLEFPYYFANEEEFKNTEASKRKNWKIRDEDIINKISTEQELSGLLNKFLEGLERLIKNRKFSSTKGSEEIKTTWIRKSNSFISFCMDKLEEDYESKISKKELRKEYSQYCKEHTVTSKSDYVIKKVLQELFGVIDERREGFGGVWEWTWIGIKWKKKQP